MSNEHPPRTGKGCSNNTKGGGNESIEYDGREGPRGKRKSTAMSSGLNALIHAAAMPAPRLTDTLLRPVPNDDDDDDGVDEQQQKKQQENLEKDSPSVAQQQQQQQQQDARPPEPPAPAQQNHRQRLAKALPINNGFMTGGPGQQLLQRYSTMYHANGDRISMSYQELPESHSAAASAHHHPDNPAAAAPPYRGQAMEYRIPSGATRHPARMLPKNPPPEHQQQLPMPVKRRRRRRRYMVDPRSVRPRVAAAAPPPPPPPPKSKRVVNVGALKVKLECYRFPSLEEASAYLAMACDSNGEMTLEGLRNLPRPPPPPPPPAGGGDGDKGVTRTREV